MEKFAQDLLLIMEPVALAFAGYLAIRITGFIREKTGLQVEGYHRDALHSALSTGAEMALSMARRGEITGHVEELRSIAIAYARRSVPDALAKLNPDFKILSEIADAKISERQNKALEAVAEVSSVLGALIPDQKA